MITRLFFPMLFHALAGAILCMPSPFLHAQTKDLQLQAGQKWLLRAQSSAYRHKLDSLIIYADSAGKLFRTQEQWEPYLHSQALLADGQVGMGDILSGKQTCENAISLAQDQYLTQARPIANIYELMGFVLVYFGEMELAWCYLEEALVLKKQYYPSAHLEIVSWYEKAGHYLYYTSQNREAFKGTIEAKNIALALLNDPNTFAEERHHIQNRLLGELYINLSSFAAGLGKYAEAETYNDSSYWYRLAADPVDSAGLAENYNNKAIAHSQQEDWHSAIIYFQKAQDVFKNHPSPNPDATSSILLNLAEAHAELKQFSQSNAYLYDLIWGSGATSSSTGLEYAFILLANNFRQINQPDSAGYYYGQAERLFLQNPRYHLRQLAMLYGYRGLAAIDQQQADSAIYYFKKQQAMAEQTYDELGQVICFRNLGYAYLQDRQYPEAFAHFYSGIALLGADTAIVRQQQLPPLAQIEYLSDLMLMIEHLANVYRYLAFTDPLNAGRWQSSLKAHELTLEMIDSLRARSFEDATRQEIAKITSHIFENGMEASNQLIRMTRDSSYLNRMWPFLEKSKSSMLLAGVRQHQIAFSDELLRREWDIRREITSKQSQLRQKNGEDPALIEQSYQLKEEQARLLGVIESKYPGYLNKLFDTSVEGLEVVRERLLSDQEVFLSYYWGIDELYYMAISKTQTHTGVIDFDSTDLVEIVKRLDDYLYTSAHLANPEVRKAGFIEHAFALYELLLQPLSDLIAHKKLIISPSGNLTRIPFELLLTSLPASETTPYKDLPYLIRQHTIRYAYGATLLLDDKRQHDLSKKTRLLVVAPVEFSDKNHLPATREEAKEVARFFPGRKLIGKAASVEAFRAESSNYQILHLATHGHTDTLFPLNSALRLSGEDQDQLYTLREIYGVPIQAELVVLSACETASGPHLSGEGVLSLGRGFRYAGAKSVVMSLWQASGPESNRLMGLFYEELAAGQAKDQALRSAKLRFLEQSYEKDEIPFYWANFVLYGDNSPVPAPARIGWIVAGILALLGIAAIGGIWRWRRRSNPIG